MPFAVRRLVALASLLALTTAACASDTDDAAVESSAGPTVVTTTGIWADVTRMVACDGLAEVTSIVPRGSDAHAYEASLQDRATLDAAQLVVVNGLGLEEGLESTLEEVEAAGTPVLAVGEAALDAEPVDDHGHEDEEQREEPEHGESEREEPEHADGDDDHGGVDPHVWLDPTLVSASLPALADALVDEAGLDRAAVDACVADAQAALGDLDEELQVILAAVPSERRELITDHDALAFFADRYGFEVVGSVIPSTSTLAAADPAMLAELSGEITPRGLPAIFAEVGTATRDLQAVADDAGVQVVELHVASLGEPDSDAGTYQGMLRTDAERIAAALG